MLCSVLLRVVAVQARKVGMLCPSVTLQYVFNPPRVLSLLVVCCGKPVTHDLIHCPSSSAAPYHSPHITPFLQYTFQVHLC